MYQNAFANDPDALTVEDEWSKSMQYLAHWRHDRAGDFNALWEAANGARGTLRGFVTKRGNISTDTRLSDVAKQDDVRKAAVNALTELGGRQRALSTAIEATNSRRMALAKVKDPTPADAVYDVEVGRYLRSLQGDARQAFVRDLMTGAEPRAVEAVLRQPAFLTGLTPQMLGIIRSAAVERAHPEEAEKLKALDEAAQTAQRVLQKVAQTISSEVKLEPDELMAAYGDGSWQHFMDGLDALAANARKQIDGPTRELLGWKAPRESEAA